MHWIGLSDLTGVDVDRAVARQDVGALAGWVREILDWGVVSKEEAEDAREAVEEAREAVEEAEDERKAAAKEAESVVERLQKSVGDIGEDRDGWKEVSINLLVELELLGGEAGEVVRVIKDRWQNSVVVSPYDLLRDANAVRELVIQLVDTSLEVSQLRGTVALLRTDLADSKKAMFGCRDRLESIRKLTDQVCGVPKEPVTGNDVMVQVVSQKLDGLAPTTCQQNPQCSLAYGHKGPCEPPVGLVAVNGGAALELTVATTESPGIKGTKPIEGLLETSGKAGADHTLAAGPVSPSASSEVKPRKRRKRGGEGPRVALAQAVPPPLGKLVAGWSALDDGGNGPPPATFSAADVGETRTFEGEGLRAIGLEPPVEGPVGTFLVTGVVPAEPVRVTYTDATGQERAAMVPADGEPHELPGAQTGPVTINVREVGGPEAETGLGGGWEKMLKNTAETGRMPSGGAGEVPVFGRYLTETPGAYAGYLKVVETEGSVEAAAEEVNELANLKVVEIKVSHEAFEKIQDMVDDPKTAAMMTAAKVAAGINSAVPCACPRPGSPPERCGYHANDECPCACHSSSVVAPEPGILKCTACGVEEGTLFAAGETCPHCREGTLESAMGYADAPLKCPACGALEEAISPLGAGDECPRCHKGKLKERQVEENAPAADPAHGSEPATTYEAGEPYNRTAKLKEVRETWDGLQGAVSVVATDTVVALVDAVKQQIDPADGGKWALICDRHGSLLQDTNKTRLGGHMRTPWEWCGACGKAFKDTTESM